MNLSTEKDDELDVVEESLSLVAVLMKLQLSVGCRQFLGGLNGRSR